MNDEEDAVVEMESDAIAKADRIAWAFWLYLVLRWGYDLLIFFSERYVIR